MKNIRYLLIGFLVVLTGCEVIPSGPRTLVLDGDSYAETTLGPLTSWRCMAPNSFYGVLVEVGRFTDARFSGVGFVLYDGTNSGEVAAYKRDGLDHRWDWGPNGADYTFTINPEGDGFYYDFSAVKPGVEKTADDVYDCY